MNATIDPRAMLGAQNNADWYAMMWDIHGLRYTRDAHGFRAIDPPPPYHSWATVLPDAPIVDLVTPLLQKPDFGMKDCAGVHDLTTLGLRKLFDATWLWHAAGASADSTGWDQITSSEALADWEDAWRDTSPSDQRQFPDPILKRADVALWGRRGAGGYDAGFVANVSEGAVGLSNLFGSNARPAATALCAWFANGLPIVGYESGDDLADALATGWEAVGKLTIWATPQS